NTICTEDCDLPSGKTSIQFVRDRYSLKHNSYRINSVSAHHEFREHDPIFGNVEIQFSEQSMNFLTLSSLPDLGHQEDFFYAERGLNALISQLLTPGVLKGIEHFVSEHRRLTEMPLAQNGKTTLTRGGPFSIKKGDGSSDRLFYLLQKNSVSSFAEELLIDPRETLPLVFWPSKIVGLLYYKVQAIDKDLTMTIWTNQGVRVNFEFGDKINADSKLLTLKRFTASNQVRTSKAEVKILFADGQVDQIQKRYDQRLRELEENEKSQKRQKEDKQKREEAASDGKFSNRLNSKNANTYYHADHDRIFTVAKYVKIIHGEITFRLAESPSAKVFVIKGVEYKINYMRDGMITTTSSSGKVITGHFERHQMKNLNGEVMDMIDVTLFGLDSKNSAH
ncbi:MAG TPA: hypothetical protein PLU50_09570, partial [Pseudobdellovibrionaceae bacterium]|nr:hypothetical protein [Pseudobdellovibrionaceae bacterium]